MDEITLQNYEAFFVLYMDGELDAEASKSVENFLIIHPHLQDEMDALLSTRLQPETFSFNKEALFSHSMKQSGLSEDLLSYIDGELDEKSGKALELELQINDSLKEEHEALLQTKLDASEFIPCPDKESLYRRTRVITMPFLLRAAAIILLILFGSIMLLNNNEVVDPIPANTTATVLPASPQETKISSPQTQIEVKRNEVATIQTEKSSPSRYSEEKIKVEPQPIKIKEDAPIAAVTLVKEDENIQRPTSIPQDAFVLNKSFNSVSIEHENISAKSDVTFAQPQRTTTEEQVIAVSNEGKTGGLKTFFKKATRVIAQTARLDLTTNEDKVLIAGIAVDLK